MQVKEADIVNAVKQTLDVLGIEYIRNNSGAAAANGRFVRFGKKGSADFIACFPGGKFAGIECKRPGEKPRPEQAAWIERIRKLGGIAIVVDSVEALKEELKRHGAAFAHPP